MAAVGGGDTAAEEAFYFSKLCHNVHLVVRRDEMRASMIMQDRVKNTPNIKIYWNTETEEVLGDKTVEGIRIRNNLSGELTILPVKGFLWLLGTSQTPIFSGAT